MCVDNKFDLTYSY